jgi:hypothetical protein
MSFNAGLITLTDTRGQSKTLAVHHVQSIDWREDGRATVTMFGMAGASGTVKNEVHLNPEQAAVLRQFMNGALVWYAGDREWPGGVEAKYRT